MFTTTKTRKAVINQNPSAAALVKVCGGYKVFADYEEIAMGERNTGRAIPETAYVDYRHIRCLAKILSEFVITDQ